MEQYYGTVMVKRTNANDELQHFKYIKREKKNGKWVYYYDDSKLKKYEKGAIEELPTRTEYDGSKQTSHTSTRKYRQTDSLFDKQSHVSFETKDLSGNPHKRIIVTSEQGKLSRAQAKGEKWIYDNLLKPKNTVSKKIKRTSRDIEKAVDKGKKKVEKLFNNARKKVGIN